MHCCKTRLCNHCCCNSIFLVSNKSPPHAVCPTLRWRRQVLMCVQMGLFSLGAVQALAAALYPLCSWLLPDQTLHPPIGQVSAHAVLSLGISLGVVAVWLVFRSSAWAWLLQDLLGITLIVMVLRQFRLPDIKVCSTSDLKHQGTLCAEGLRQLGACTYPHAAVCTN